MERAALSGRLSARPRLAWRLATVAEVVDESARARTLRLDVEGWSGHRAGQHVDIRLTAEDGYQAERSYSIASAPESGRVDLTIALVEGGEVSSYLFEEVRPGDVFELRGPIGGHFTWSVQDGGPLLLIAGGSGLVPLMSMLRHRAAQESDVPAFVLASFRSEAERLYGGELESLRPRTGLHVALTYTRSPPSGWSGWNRRVDTEMLAALGPGPAAHPRSYVCGPTAFVEHVTRLLVEAGHEPDAIRAERFGPTGG